MQEKYEIVKDMFHGFDWSTSSKMTSSGIGFRPGTMLFMIKLIGIQ
ncbi:MAG TPA: hypothetical protein VFE98_08830 [Candidatus Bathyarchaeia archaeon]|nr:hypothetical protein [Candidatus Bathyarchaeia archaeon]